MYISDISDFSPLPVVDVDNIELPQGGTLYSVPDICTNKFSKDIKCTEHYKSVSLLEDGDVKQCPYGFTSRLSDTGSIRLAMTCYVPSPRSGGSKEKARAKDYPATKLNSEILDRADLSLCKIVRTIDSIEREIATRQTAALHEIRKLNSNVKQEAERMCVEQSPDDPDRADPRLVSIWKSSEMMSQQFDVTELLASENLVKLGLNIVSNIYQIFDKVVKTYSFFRKDIDVLIRAPYGYVAEVRANNRTFPVIATVLIENAIKYSEMGYSVFVDIEDSEDVPDKCVVRVSNVSKDSGPIQDALFRRGVRGSNDKEGSGYGLYVASLVARQHGTEIKSESKIYKPGLRLYTFKIEMEKVIKKASARERAPADGRTRRRRPRSR